MKVLFDHNMPPRMARTLHAFIERDGHSAVALRDKFAQNISDIAYFTALGTERDWIVISKDTANHKRAAERQAIMASGVLAFYLSPGSQKKPANEQMAILLWHWPAIVQRRGDTRNGMFQLPENRGKQFKTL
ncbi:MAG: PIN-like domain-containing protein [Shimia sp.]